MPVQRACDAESQAGSGAPNGPPRVQSNVGDRKVFCNVGAYVSCRGCVGIPLSAWAARQILENVSTHCYLLESAQANEKWGRYTFLGYDPKMEITCVNGTLRTGDVTLHTDDPSAVLRDILARYKSPRLPGLPTFTGGLVGYFSYDYLGYREPKARTDAQDTENFKDVDLMLFDKVIAFDNRPRLSLFLPQHMQG